MGLLDSITSVLSNQEGGQGGMLGVITGLIDQAGGIQGLANTFQEKGLGELVSSWIGTGQNLPISGEQLNAVLGNEQVQAIAEKLGLPLGDASNGLAALLPQVVDKLTPDGQVPEAGCLLEQGLSLLKGLGRS